MEGALMDLLSCTTVLTDVGELTVVASDRGVRAVLWPGEHVGDAAGRVRVTASSTATPAAASILQHAVAQLQQYFAGTRTEFDLPLDPQGTEFQQQAWAVLCGIPFGQTISYGEQASRLGDRNKARAVGAANGKNPISVIVPCHRVVGSTGSLTGFAGGLDTKTWLLEHEQRVAATTVRR